MPYGLRRFQESKQTHFVTFTCFHRRRGFDSPAACDLFIQVLEDMRCRFVLRVYGYVVMPEHVHLLLSEPEISRLAPKSGARTSATGKEGIANPRLAPDSGARTWATGARIGTRSWATQVLLADAMHYLKLSFAKRLGAGVFWQKRYYDRNVRDEREFESKLRYIHRNPVKRGLCENPEDWKWSSFRHYALREKGMVEIESEWTARDRKKQGDRIFVIPG